MNVIQRFEHVALVRFAVTAGRWCWWADRPRGPALTSCMDRNGQYTGLRTDDVLVIRSRSDQWVMQVLSVTDKPKPKKLDGRKRDGAPKIIGNPEVRTFDAAV